MSIKPIYSISILPFFFMSCIFTLKGNDGKYHYSYCTSTPEISSKYEIITSNTDEALNHDSTLITLSINDLFDNNETCKKNSVGLRLKNLDNQNYEKYNITHDSVLQIKLERGNYYLFASSSCTGLNTIEIDTLLFKPNTHYRMQITLGLGSSFSDYDISSKFKLTKFQYEHRSKKIRKQIESQYSNY